MAVAALPINAWQNPKVLERLQSIGEQIRIGEGQRLTISIRASPTPHALGARLELLRHELRLTVYGTERRVRDARPEARPSPRVQRAAPSRPNQPARRGV